MTQLVHLMDGLNANTSQLSSQANRSSTSPPAISLPSSNTNIQNFGVLLSNLSSTMSQVQPHVAQLSALLQNEPSMQDATTRESTQQLSNNLAAVLQQMGTMAIFLSASLQSVRLGRSASEATAVAPSQVHITGYSLRTE